MNPLASRITEPCVIITALGSGFAARHPHFMKATTELINMRIAQCVGFYEDFCDDLDMMHEAEKTLSDEEWVAYIDCLKRITVAGGNTYRDVRSLVAAKAKQRAQAFYTVRCEKSYEQSHAA